MKLTFPKWGLGSPPGLPKFQSSIAGAKTPCIGVFFISLEAIEVQMSKMGSHGPFGHLQNTLWQKERPGIKLAI
jgi:hypothetical protein